MSIYRRRSWNDVEDINQPRARGETAAPAKAPSSDSSAGSHDWSKQRRAVPMERLLPASEKWLQLLPPDVFPAALAAQYPRLVNLIAVHWNDGSTYPAFFDELLVDRRGARQGFPAAVKHDLERLRAYWYTGGPTRKE